jgi:hypothetical protein
LAFGVFGGVALVGFLLSFGIRSRDLEVEGWNEDGNSVYESDDDENLRHVNENGTTQNA